MKITSIFLILVLYASQASADITAREALTIARTKLADTFYMDAYFLRWTIVRNETRWEYFNKTTAYLQVPPEEIEICDKLKSHDYWGVFIWGEKSGHIDFYIDRNNGKIIASEPSEDFISKYFKYKIDIDDAIKIAEGELIKKKYNLQNMVLVVEEANYPTLNISLKNNKSITEMIDVKKLNDKFKRVWEVYYHPKKDFEKGDIIIIIDSDTGKIEYVLENK